MMIEVKEAMWALVIVVAIMGVVLALFPNAACAYAYGCGIKPIAPLGCKSSDAICVCSSTGDCEWVFVGCG